eukprot:362627-Chlamydomonas_euryale.AAC.4
MEWEGVRVRPGDGSVGAGRREDAGVRRRTAVRVCGAGVGRWGKEVDHNDQGSEQMTGKLSQMTGWALPGTDESSRGR